MSSLSHISDASLRKLLGNRCLVKPTLAANDSDDATIKNTGAVLYSIDGVVYTKSALAAQSIAVTHGCFGNVVAAGPAAYVQPQNTSVFYVVALNAGGSVAVVQGSYLGQSIAFANDLTKVLTGDGAIPVEPEGYTAIGVIKVTTAAATTFTPGTTKLDAAGVTIAFYDVAVLPASL